jgi:hypothetical protein
MEGQRGHDRLFGRPDIIGSRILDRLLAEKALAVKIKELQSRLWER